MMNEADEILIELYRQKNSLTIARSLIRLMTAREVLKNFDFTFAQYYKVRLMLLDRLEELCAEDNTNVGNARQMIGMLLERGSSTPSRKRRVLDYTIGRLIVHLSPEEQLGLVGEFIEGSRASRRNVALQIIARHFVPDHKDVLLDHFRRYRKQQALKILTRVDTDITEIADYLLQNLEDQYEKARVFEKLIAQNYDLASTLAPTYPLAFVWGAGRAECTKALPTILNTLDGTHEKDKGLVIWALGKLQAKQELQWLIQLYEVDMLHFPRLS